LFWAVTGTDRHTRDTVLALTLGGAAAYGAGTLLVGQQRQRAYLAGHDALGCLILAYVPLLVTTTEYEELRASIETLSHRISTTGQRLEIVRRSALTGAPAIAAAEAALVRGQAVLTTAAALRRDLDGAAISLIAQVDTVRGAVSEAIVEEEPNVDEILRAASGIGVVAATLGQVPADLGLRTDQPEVDEPQSMDRAPELSADVLLLEQAIIDTQAVLGRVGKVRGLVEDSMAASDACALVAPLRLQPPQVSVARQAGATITESVVIGGGKPPYTARMQRFPAPGISLDPPEGAENAFSIAVSGEAEPGDYGIHVRDDEGRSQVFTLTVEAVAALGAVEEGQALSRAAAPAPAIAAVTRPVGLEGDEITHLPEVGLAMRVQAALCTRADGVFGSSTRRAIRDFQMMRQGATAGSEPPGRLTGSQIRQLLDEGDCPDFARSYIERTYTPKQISEILKEIGVPGAQGVVSDEARTYIRQYQSARRIEPTGTITHELLHVLETEEQERGR
jgi:hypothetical protein